MGIGRDGDWKGLIRVSLLEGDWMGRRLRGMGPTSLLEGDWKNPDVVARGGWKGWILMGIGRNDDWKGESGCRC